MKRPFVFVLISMLCVFAAGADNIALSDVVSGIYNPKSVRELTPMSDGEHYLSLSDDKNCIVRFSFKDGSVTDTVLNLSTVKGNDDNIVRLEGFTLSPKEDRILLQTDTKKIFRRSFTAEYYLFTIKNNRMEQLSTGGAQQSPKFSPDGNVIGFVRDGNIFLVKLMFNNAESQVTKDGAKGFVSNGIPDWAYEEEFSSHRLLTSVPTANCWHMFALTRAE